ncbi:MAG: DsbA family oxidoreductase, partial [Belnapia sp.]|nr:DsbA family oxidoreductase [Belnapia sp.]
LAGDEGAEEVRAEDASFRRGGLSGVPTFALEGHVLFSGAMPPGQIAAAFRQGLGILRERAKAAYHKLGEKVFSPSPSSFYVGSIRGAAA